MQDIKPFRLLLIARWVTFHAFRNYTWIFTLAYMYRVHDLDGSKGYH